MTMLPAGVKVHLAFGHMRLQRAGSSRSSHTIKPTDRNLRSTAILHLRKPLVTAWLLRVVFAASAGRFWISQERQVVIS